MYYLVQSLIIFAIMASNIYLQWTPNTYLAGLFAVGAAFFATLGLNQLLLWARKKPGNRSR
jgi:hypothetical protein